MTAKPLASLDSLDLAQFEGYATDTSAPCPFGATRFEVQSTEAYKGMRLAIFDRLPDAKLFASAPALLAECRRQREQIQALREALTVCADTLLKRGMPSQHEMLAAARQARAALKVSP